MEASSSLAFIDADGNVIHSVVDVANSSANDGHGVTIVTTDSLVGSHFLNADPVTKIEIDDDVSQHMEIMSPPGVGSSKKGMKGANALPAAAGTADSGEKKVCLWPIGNGTTCGKTFTKFDSLNHNFRNLPYAPTD